MLGGLFALLGSAVLVVLVSSTFWLGRQSSDTLELPTFPPVSTIESAADRPVPTVTDFYPEDNNLSDCVGLVEQPGCGSEARGGSGQTLVLVALVLGLGFIFWRISAGLRANRDARSVEAAEPAGDGQRPA